MRKRRNKKNNKTYLVIFFVLFSLLLSTGYSLFSDALQMNGSATLKPIISGNVLNVGLIQTTGRYTTGTLPTDTTFLNETLVSNDLTINFRRNKAAGKTINSILRINFTNNYHLNLTAGSVSTQIVSGAINVVSQSATLSKTALIPNESGILTLNLGHKTSSTQIIHIRATMQYTVNGLIQYFYYNVFIN